MTHLTTRDIFEYPRQAAGRQEEIRGHIGSCAECRALWEAHQRTWEVLGFWEAEAVPDQTGAILARLETAPRERRVASFWLIRAAAAVVIAAGAGFAAGVAIRVRPASAAIVEQVASELHLNEVNGGVSEELQSLFAPAPEDNKVIPTEDSP